MVYGSVDHERETSYRLNDTLVKRFSSLLDELPLNAFPKDGGGFDEAALEMAWIAGKFDGMGGVVWRKIAYC